MSKPDNLAFTLESIAEFDEQTVALLSHFSLTERAAIARAMDSGAVLVKIITTPGAI